MSLERVAPVFPVRDIHRAVEHYRRLGFAVRLSEDSEEYAFAERDGVEIHVTQVAGLKPKRNMSAVYLYVDDADALYREWRSAGVDGRLVEPSDTSYGLREGACLDRDANLIRFGSALAR
jgi:predicted enzyme related to lactoylglutathione lyase